MNFIVYTFATVGYGTSVPTDLTGYILTMGIVITGLLCFSYFVAEMEKYSDTNVDYIEYKLKRNETVDYWIAKLERVSINGSAPPVFPTVKKHFSTFFNNDISDAFGSKFFNLLPRKAQETICEQELTKLARLFQAFFSSVDSELHFDIITCLRFRWYKQNTVILQSNEISPGFYFIESGEVVLAHPDDIQTPILYLTQGCYFGDYVLLLDQQYLPVR